MIAPLLFLLQWDVDDVVFQLEHKGLNDSTLIVSFAVGCRRLSISTKT